MQIEKSESMNNSIKRTRTECGEQNILTRDYLFLYSDMRENLKNYASTQQTTELIKHTIKKCK